MAMGKNKTGIMAAISAAAEGNKVESEPRERAQRTLPKGTIGSVRAGLGGIQEINTDLILPWGPVDRLDPELTAVNNGDVPTSISELVESISTSGQQIPVLLRPAEDKDGYFEVVYGRRRIMACRCLGLDVKALIRTLDNTEALKAKGLENATRSDLSFYERARFATAILEQGYERSLACEALSISKNSLSQYERVTRIVPDSVGDAIGSASGSGRPKWMALVALFDEGKVDEIGALATMAALPDEIGSDERLNAIIQSTRKTVEPKSKRKFGTRSPMDGIQINSSEKKISVSIARNGKNEAFADWLDSNLEVVLEEAFERFKINT